MARRMIVACKRHAVHTISQNPNYRWKWCSLLDTLRVNVSPSVGLGDLLRTDLLCIGPELHFLLLLWVLRRLYA